MSHVCNDCTELQIQALRDDIYAKKTEKVFKAEYLVNDPTNALTIVLLVYYISSLVSVA